MKPVAGFNVNDVRVVNDLFYVLCLSLSLFPSLSLFLKASLNKLMETLGQSEPYFVKCIRSNAEKVYLPGTISTTRCHENK